MTLSDEVLAAIQPDGILVAALRALFKDAAHERLDAAILGLARRGEAKLVGGKLHPSRATLAIKCKRCGARHPHDQFIDSGICLSCASIEAQKMSDHPKTCKNCGTTRTEHEHGHGLYCKPCTRVRARSCKERRRAREAAREGATV